MANSASTRSNRGPSVSDVLTDIMCIFGVTFVSLSGIAVYREAHPSERVAAHRFDEPEARLDRTDGQSETGRLLGIRATIVGNMPDECRGEIAISLPKGPPADEAAMLATVRRLCPQAFESE